MKIIIYNCTNLYAVLHTHNLYEEYVNVTAEQVTMSNECIPDHSSSPWLHDNLVYLMDQLSNSSEASFLQQCLDQYDGYPAVQQGGPLLYCIIQHCLMSTSLFTVNRLVQQITNLKISDTPGENVNTSIGSPPLLRAYLRLYHWCLVPCN